MAPAAVFPVNTGGRAGGPTCSLVMMHMLGILYIEFTFVCLMAGLDLCFFCSKQAVAVFTLRLRRTSS